ncbi:MAG: ABC transporter ATP-binding protein [Pseudomonadota bacterium]
MSSWRIIKGGWEILEPRDRRNAVILLLIVLLSAAASAAMVGSFMPFLYVLADPSTIQSSSVLSDAYNRFGFQTEANFLSFLGAACLGIILFAAMIQFIRVYAVARWCMMRMHSISQRLLISYLGQPYESFLSQNSGALSTQILSESQAVVAQFYRPVTEAFAGIFTVLAIFALLLFVYPIIALSTVGLFTLIYGLVFLLTKNVSTRAGARRLAANKERFRMVGEAFGGIKTVKLGGYERTYVQRYRQPSLRFARSQILISVLGELPRNSMQAVAFAGGVGFFLYLIGNQKIGSEALASAVPVAGVFAAAAVRIMPELSRIYFGMVKLQAAGPAIEAIQSELNCEQKQIARSGKRLRLKNELEIRDVSYEYPSSNRGMALNHITDTIRAGEKIGIIGGTGAGKTTFIDIVLGLLLPTTGALILDGEVLSEDNKRAWRKSIGYVPQQIFLSDGTVAANIAFGVSDEEIDMVRVERAARIAQIHSFVVDDLPGGYQHMVGEDGVRLSGGQRQRIGIARALYDDPDLIVFDEATSALDNLTEQFVISAIEEMAGNKTLIMVAHRLSTVRNCDRIFLFENGKIVSKGGWEELEQNSVKFQTMAQQISG